MSEQKKVHKRSGWLIAVAILLSVIVIGVSFMGGFLTSCVMRGKTVGTIGNIVSIMENVGYIYDPVTNEKRTLTEEDYADALVNAFLDDYSAYYTPEEYSVELSKSLGDYQGVGVGFYGQSTKLDMVVGNSPAYKAGLREGDKIIKAECGDKQESFTTSNQIINFLQACGSKEVLIYIEGKEQPFIVSASSYVASYVLYYDSEKIYEFISQDGNQLVGLARDNDEYTDIDKDNHDTAYIRLDLFEASAAKQLGEALEYMNMRGRTKLVLDLRNNGGGYMDVLIDVASYFINNNGAKKSLVACAIDKNGKEQAFTTNQNLYKKFLTSTVVIANENTASASECLIGAMHYYGVLGENPEQKIVLETNGEGVAKTYGKGIMQTTYILRNGGAFKLTTAKIYWPDKTTCIHGKGVTQGQAATKENAVKVAVEKL